MMLWLRPQCILAIVTSLYYYSELVSSKTYDKFYCSTEEGHHQLTCPDESALLTDVTILKIYRRTEMCEPDVHSDYLVHCQGSIDGSICEGNKTCSIEVSSRNYIRCGEKVYAPTYFFVKYTCTQIHTMCVDNAPLRNTLYGFIVSPAYPHPMADNLKCSISIEADPSMYIELTPVQLRLQEGMKCRSEYIEIFGYINSISSNTSSDGIQSDKTSRDVWKSYHTWCGADRSTNHPSANSRYLISSNSLYISLQTGFSKKPRYFKLRYKVVPAIARAQYDLDGIASDSPSGSAFSLPIGGITTTAVISTTIVVPVVDNRDVKSINGTSQKGPIRKEILIGIVAGFIVLILAILIGVAIFLLLKRRRTPSMNNTTKKTPPASSTNNNNNNNSAKGTAKPVDKAPLLESANPATNAAATKRKLVPERTVQIADVNTSRFKPGPGANTSGKSGTTGKENSSTSSDAVPVTSNATTTNKVPLTAADSGIYGADLSDDVQTTSKTTPANTDSQATPQIYGLDLPDKSEKKSSPPPPAVVSVVINPLSENQIAPATENKTVQPVPVTANHVSTTPLVDLTPEESERCFGPNRFDETIKSAYSNLIDATISESEGNFAGGSVASSAAQSRRTSYVRQALISHETNMTESIPRKTTQFNPLHVILKKDANKYYTTEYI